MPGVSFEDDEYTDGAWVKHLNSPLNMSFATFDKQYIDGAWVPSSQPGKYIQVMDSNTAQPIGQVPDGTAEDMTRAIEAAKAAFPSWSETPLGQRKEAIARIIEKWQGKKAQCVNVLQKELGCTEKFAHDQAGMVDLYVGASLKSIDSIQFEERTAMGALVVKEPIGVVGCITPWNYPGNQMAAKIAPAMIVGCTVVLKPSEVTPICAYLLAEAVHEAGLPKGVFNMVMGRGPGCGEVLSHHPAVDCISFTGSTRAGKQITEASAATLKVVRTELGGKGATLMLEDADLPELMPTFVMQLMANSGQTCRALSRMVVPRSRYEEAVGLAKIEAEKVKVGRSGDKDSVIGPVVSEVQYDKIQGLIKKGIDEGARLVTGGLGKPAGLEDGYFVKPTVFADVHNKMTIAQEEIFGPVLSIIPYTTEQEGIDIVNDTIYGLNNAVGSSDSDKALAVARKLRSGTVMVNGTTGPMDAPFGGYKQSGNAREMGTYGLEEFLVVKHMAGKPPKSKL